MTLTLHGLYTPGPRRLHESGRTVVGSPVNGMAGIQMLCRRKSSVISTHDLDASASENSGQPRHFIAFCGRFRRNSSLRADGCLNEFHIGPVVIDKRFGSSI